MILGLFKVSGHSMTPRLKPNDRVLISSLPYFFSKPKEGHVVLFNYNNRALIKRIIRIEGKKYFIDGDNKKDSLKIGWINRKDIQGKLIL